MVEVLAGLGNPANAQKWSELAKVVARESRSSGKAPSRVRTRQRQRHLSPAEAEKLVDLFLAGEERFDLAQRFRIHPDTVSVVLKRHGLTWERGLSPDHIREAARLYVDEGWSCAKIGDALGFNAGTVRNALLRAGVQTRPRAW